MIQQSFEVHILSLPVQGLNTAADLVKKLREDDVDFGEVQHERYLRATVVSR